jgi:hypothetical protein
VPAPLRIDTKLDWEDTPPIATANSEERPKTLFKEGCP